MHIVSFEHLGCIKSVNAHLDVPSLKLHNSGIAHAPGPDVPTSTSISAADVIHILCPDLIVLPARMERSSAYFPT